MSYFYLVYLIIPCLILFNINKTDEKKAKKIRLVSAIPSILFILLEGVMYILGFAGVMNFVDMVDEDPKLFFIPILLLIVTIISYNSGKRKEKLYYLDLGSKELENVRFQKVRGRTSLNIVTDENKDDIEML